MQAEKWVEQRQMSACSREVQVYEKGKCQVPSLGWSVTCMLHGNLPFASWTHSRRQNDKLSVCIWNDELSEDEDVWESPGPRMNLNEIILLLVYVTH